MPFQGANFESGLLAGLVLVAIILISLSFHEFAHALVANLFGDPTAKLEGRLSINPMRHWDTLGTTLLVLLVMMRSIGLAVPIFGWGKPVPVDERNFDNPRIYGLQTALAGPMANFVLAGIFTMFIRFLPLPSFLILIFSLAVYLNIFLMFFNLMPIPPLDGSRLLRLVLPDSIYYSLSTNPITFFLLIFVAIFFLLGYIENFSIHLSALLIG